MKTTISFSLLDKGFKGIVVNRVLLFLHNVTWNYVLQVPLTKLLKLFFYDYVCFASVINAVANLYIYTSTKVIVNILVRVTTDFTDCSYTLPE